MSIYVKFRWNFIASCLDTVNKSLNQKHNERRRLRNNNNEIAHWISLRKPKQIWYSLSPRQAAPELLKDLV